MSNNKMFIKEPKEVNYIKLTENCIVGIIKIKKDNLKQKIINSYENVKREEPWNWYWDEMKVNNNEEEIKNCEIYINEKKIKFNYYYNFPKEGDYIIKYKFKKLLKYTNYMFDGCSSLTSLDLSSFNTQNVTNMEYMFYDCNSLISLDLSNFNTQNVDDMRGMFFNCNSLISLNLFNRKVNYMGSLFYNCNSLEFKIINKFHN